MATTTLTRNLKLRLNSNLTADAAYNLQRIDLLGATFLVDSTDSLNIRSRTNITIEPDSADLGGNSTGGTLSIGSTNHSLDSTAIYTDAFTLSSPFGLLDQASAGTKYLRLRYKSDLSGVVDTVSDRVLSVDLQGGDRNLIFEGNLSVLGGAVTLNTSAGSTVIVPAIGTLVTLDGSETLTNKNINANLNTIQNISNGNVAAAAAIAYSKLNLTGSIINADVASAAGIVYSKLLLTGGIVNADISASASISRSKIATGNISQVLINDASGNFTSEATLAVSRGGTGAAAANSAFNNLVPSQTGNSGKVLSTDGSNTSWVAAGLGSVTSVAVSMPGEFTVTGSPITLSGTIAVSKALQTANEVYAGPISGPSAVPVFRTLVAADIPALSHSSLSNLSADDHPQYHTDARALTWLGTRSTSDLAEGTNLYYTAARFNTAFSGKSTTDLAEGINLYYTDERVDDRVAVLIQNGTGLTWTYNDPANTLTGNVSLTPFSTTNLSEGSNLYYTQARFDTAFAAKSTTNLTEGSNLYFTTARANTAIDAYKVTTTWSTGDGTSKAITHSLGTLDTSTSIYEIDSGEEILVDLVVHTSTSVTTLTSSSAPTGSGWKVIIRK